ncbi:MAG: hypothetical protein WA950_12290 [Shinella sp.]|uniref:hypothetical protein n=1 Tax=Shinella sp. TaxID=1870904 RepID=UPI003C709114
MRTRKWTKGRKLSPIEALAEIAAGRPVYFRDKWTHNGWARGWQIAMVIGSANSGVIFEAIRIQGIDE